MKSVGEVMAIGRTFQESFQKALRGLEIGVDGLDEKSSDLDLIAAELGHPGPERIWYVADAFRQGMSFDEIYQLTHIDPWFLHQIEDLIKQEQSLTGTTLNSINTDLLRQLKRSGFSDRRLAKLLDSSELAIRTRRLNEKYVRYINVLIPVPPSFPRVLLIFTLLMRKNVKLIQAQERRLWFWVGAEPHRTGN